MMCTQQGEPRNDTKFRGGFTPQPDGGFIYHCHNCGFATKWEKDGRVGKNLMKFLTTLGVSAREIPLGLRLLKKDEKATNLKARAPDITLDFDEVDLPQDAHTIEEWARADCTEPDFLSAISYLSSRGSAVFSGTTYYWTPTSPIHPEMKWNRRIIIPFYHHGKIVGYTGRKTVQSDPFPKYFNNKPEHFMYNQDKLESDDEVIFLVEGILDAVAINGVATLKNNLTQRQLNLLNRYDKRIIMIPDRNRAGQRLLNHALDQGWEVSIPDWDRIDDVAAATKKYGKLYTIYSIMKHTTKDPVKIQTRFNIVKNGNKQ